MATLRTVPSRVVQTPEDLQRLADDLVLAFNGLVQRFFWGSGTPEGAVSAPIGSVFLRSDGSTSTTLYVKTSGTGNTGWTAK